MLEILLYPDFLKFFILILEKKPPNIQFLCYLYQNLCEPFSIQLCIKLFFQVYFVCVCVCTEKMGYYITKGIFEKFLVFSHWSITYKKVLEKKVDA